MIQRFSSRKLPLDVRFLNARLKSALGYDRIAGYFSSSILEIAGETLESVQGTVRMVCNSTLDAKDVETARAAKYAMRRSWCASRPEELGRSSRDRFSRLYDFLKSGKLRVKVLPDEKFGLIHGKAGVVTLADGSRTSFIGSVNESFSAWKINYELLWEDDDPEAVAWVQEEFDALWESPFAVALADCVVEDVGRLSKRTVVGVSDWKQNPEPASAVIETPVYRKEYGLWEHQKYFVKTAFEAHRKAHGARFVLADQVGLGKTVQLALSAMLMALYGDKPILALLPKPLIWQWQTELNDLLDMPSAVWTGKAWIDEHGIEHPVSGPDGILKCPRRMGIVSQGLIIQQSEISEYLKRRQFECIIVDEAHRARRKNLGPNKSGEKPEPNNLYEFLSQAGLKTRSLLLATGTPVQMYPIEAWDLLNILSAGTDAVLGNKWSNWTKHAEKGLNLVAGNEALPQDDLELWGWIRNPLPPASENFHFSLVRQSLRLSENEPVAPGDAFEKLPPPDRQRVREMRDRFAREYNPFIRHIVRRTRKYLEDEIDGETGEPYLKKVEVELFGESEPLRLPFYLQEAYRLAETFCKRLGKRMKASGFMKTLLLRRVGSTIHAGRTTAEKILGEWGELDLSEEDLMEETADSNYRDEQGFSENFAKDLTPGEKQLLRSFVDSLDANKERDPKFLEIISYLLDKGWLDMGCIVFSQYWDSIDWLGKKLSSETLPEEPVGIYAGGRRSGIMLNGVFRFLKREEVKAGVMKGDIRLLLGTDAASEGLNLQKLGTLINLDLPWNPTRLEQRKGRIQRIGQSRDTVYILNMRYKDSVEDRVHELLSERLESIYGLFGQIPDVLEDAWVFAALGDIEKARQTIGNVPEQHPFDLKYRKVEKTDWETCAQVLESGERKRLLSKGW